MEIDNSPLGSLPEKFFECLGVMSVWFVVLENLMRDSIAELTSKDLKTKRLLAGKTFSELSKKLKKVLLQKVNNDELLKNELIKICDRLKTIAWNRNECMHSVFFLDENGRIIRFKYSSKVDSTFFEEEIKDLESMEKLIQDIIFIFGELNNFIKRTIVKFP